MRRVTAAAVLIVVAVVTTACSDSGGLDGGISARPAATTLPATTVTTAPPAPTVPPPATSPSCPTIPGPAQPAPDRPRYRLTADVRLDENAVHGTTQVRFTPDLATDRLVFRLWANGPRPAAAGSSIETGEVTVAGRPAPATLEDRTTLVVRPDGGVPRGRAIEASLPWTLTLPGPVSDRISRTGEAVRLGSFFPLLAWEPGGGWATDPAVGAFAEASTAMVADYDLTVTVPPGLTVMASGVQDAPNHWVATAMRDVGMSIGRFTVVTGQANAPHPVGVSVGVHEGTAATADQYLAKVIDVLGDFGRRFGPYPWTTFSLAITPNLGGGIEYPGHVMQGTGTLGRTTSHEVAHMWFYGLVGNNQGRDPWLDEGLASWGEARYEEALAALNAVPMPPDAIGHMGDPMTYWASRQTTYSTGVYVQGVQALSALGPPDLVDCALRLYSAVNAHRIAKPADLMAALRAVFPDATAVMAGYGVRP